MGRVDLDDLDPGIPGAPRGVGEQADDAGELFERERAGGGPAFVPGDGARRDGGPAALLRAEGTAAFPGLMRPSGATALASIMTRPAPPTAREPRWTRCQSPRAPSSAEYWHMGETTIRFLSSRPRAVKGVKSSATLESSESTIVARTL
jgi:hypothetical protein